MNKASYALLALSAIATVATANASNFYESYSKARTNAQRVVILANELNASYRENERLSESLASLQRKVSELESSISEKDRKISELSKPETYSERMRRECERDFWKEDRKPDRQNYSSETVLSYQNSRKRDCLA